MRGGSCFLRTPSPGKYCSFSFYCCSGKCTDRTNQGVLNNLVDVCWQFGAPDIWRRLGEEKGPRSRNSCIVEVQLPAGDWTGLILKGLLWEGRDCLVQRRFPDENYFLHKNFRLSIGKSIKIQKIKSDHMFSSSRFLVTLWF